MLRALAIFTFAFFASLFFLPACQASCSTNDDCDGGDICVFSTGHCAAKCDAKKANSCSGGATCDSCASSSCPTCTDCIAACVDPGGTPGGQGGW